MKLNKPLYLLILIIEECAEVIQRVCKAIRFGLNEVQPSQTLTNSERITIEWNDLATATKLASKYGVDSVLYEALVQAKEKKIEKYMNYSSELGVLE
jgi:hypothetical protein